MKKFLIDYERNDDFGARPIKRSIQKNIEDRLAQMYLEGIVRDGDAIAMDYDGKEPVFMPLSNVLFPAKTSEKKKTDK